MKENEIVEFLEDKKTLIDSVIKKYLPEKLDKAQLEWIFGRADYGYDENALNKALTEPIWNLLNRGGKRWRPALFLLITEALGGDIEKAKDFLILPELAHNGCLNADTKILKNPGEQIRIDSIKRGDSVYTLNKKGNLETKKVLKVKMTGEKNVYRLVTNHREIKATKNHQFLVMLKNQPIRSKITPFGEKKLKKAMSRGDIKDSALILGKSESLMQNALSARNTQLLEKNELGLIFKRFSLRLAKRDYMEKQTKYERPDMKLVWKKLEELKPGDNIIVLRKTPDRGKPLNLPIPPKNPPKDKTKIPIKTNENFCQIFGYILGDGCVTINRKSPRLYLTPSNSKHERSAYKKIFKDIFDYELRSETQSGYERLVCCSYKVCWLLRKLGLEKSALSKKIPQWVFELPERQKCTLIRGYLDSDGTVAKNGFVSFSSASEELIRGLKLLVDSIGMTSGIITKRKVKNLWKASKKRESVLWSLRMSNPHKILKKIGTERPDYKKRMLKASEGINFVFSEKYPKPPLDMEYLRFDTVKKIEKIGIQSVYDIMVEESHNFIAENTIVHNSLIIDDIEDLAEMRRGKPCTHKLFGNDIAINAGNFIYFLPTLVFMKNKENFDKETLLKAWEVFSREMINIHAGQATDIYWHKGATNNITEEHYLQMCANKTGCLARMAGRLAVVLSGGSPEQEKKMGKVCETIGIAFQIQDDILSASGNEFAEKKGYGDDVTEGKRSLLVIHTLRKASQEDKKRLLEILSLHTRDTKLICEAIEIINKYNSIDYARDFAKKLVSDAWKEAEILLEESPAKKKLKKFANFLVERNI